MTLADARARVPEIDARECDPDGDQVLIERLADDCERYTPMVAIVGSDALILDLTGCPPTRGLSNRLAGYGLTIRLGHGSTPDAALARARFGATVDLGSLQVAALGLEETTVLALKRAGLKTVGDLASRPRAPLAARFGAVLLTRLDRLLGQEDARITPRRVPPLIRAERRFAEPIARVEDVMIVLGELAAEACRELDERGLGGRGFVVALFRSDGAVRRLRVESGQPTRDPGTIVRLFDERIEALADPIDPGFGFDAIRFVVIASDPLLPANPRLDGDERAGAAVEELIDRLSTRLGPRRVIRFAPRDSHVPEQAAMEFPARVDRTAQPWPKLEPREPPLRPLHLFDPPQRVLVTAEVPDGPPLQFRWRRNLHVIARCEGPERIAGEWWRRRGGHESGKGGLTRDYYRVEDVRGRRFWLFRHGLHEVETSDPSWFLHGIFV